MFYSNYSIRFFRLIFIFSTVLSPVLSFAGAAEECESVFGLTSYTRAQAEEIVKKEEDQKKSTYHPSHIDIRKNIAKEVLWNEAPVTPDILRFLLPDGVQFINHSLPYSPSSSFVRIAPPGGGSTPGGVSVIARAQYTYKGEDLSTNVAFNRSALFDNFHTGQNKKWLVGETAEAAVLFLHGGGTSTATSSNFTEEIGHYSRLGIDGIALDLPLHGNGPMNVKNLEEHILALSEFAKKYIPPHVPLFVYGHSFGGAFAEKIMQMFKKGEDEGNSFHTSFKGLIIASAPIQDSSLDTKAMLKDYVERIHKAREQVSNLVLPENNIARDLIRNNKVSLLNGIFTSLGLHEIDYSFPKHGGDDYFPALMLMGKYDQLVYMGFEDLFDDYYGKLTNVKTEYFDKEPLLGSNKSDEPVMVGHLIASYIDRQTKQPLHLKKTVDFIIDILSKESNNTISRESLKKSNRHEKNNTLIGLAQLWSNDLSFRKWLSDVFFAENMKFGQLKSRSLERQKKLSEEIEKILLIEHMQRNEKDEWIQSLKQGGASVIALIDQHVSKYQLTGNEKKELTAFLFQSFKPLSSDTLSHLEQAQSLEDFGSRYAHLAHLNSEKTTQLLDILEKMENDSPQKIGKDDFIHLLKNPGQLIDFLLDKDFKNYFNLVAEEKDFLINSRNFLIHSFSKNIYVPNEKLNQLSKTSSLEEFSELYSSLNKIEDLDRFKKLLIKEKVNKSKKKELSSTLFNTKDLEEFRKEYPQIQLLNSEERGSVLPKLGEFFKITLQENNSYIPLLEEMYASKGKDFKNDRSNKRDKRFLEEIHTITNYVNQIKEKEENISTLEKSIGILKKKNENLGSLVKDSLSAINQSFENPPAVLKKDYEQTEELLKQAESSLHAMYDHSEMLVENFLDNNIPMSNELFQSEITNNEDLQSLYQIFEDNYRRFEDGLQLVKRKHKEMAMKGDLGESLKESFSHIHGVDTESSHLLAFRYSMKAVAEKESKLIHHRNELAQLIRKYHHASPFEASSDYNAINIDTLSLTNHKSDEETRYEINQKRDFIEKIMKLWKRLSTQGAYLDL